MNKISNYKVKLAVDLMGSDNGAQELLAGCELYYQQFKNIYFKFFGKKEVIGKLLYNTKLPKESFDIVFAEEEVHHDDNPIHAVRYKKQSSMRLAIEDVKNKLSHAVLSAGNTGALMMMGKFVLGGIEKISRPAIISTVPSEDPLVFLDMGGNSSCNEDNLLDFAFMGSAYAKVMLKKDNPTVGVLNIGAEEEKGNNLTHRTHKLFKQIKEINYIGFVEGNTIFTNHYDILITDGFTGNIALKVMEGTSSFMKNKLTSAFKYSIFSKLGYLLTKKPLTQMFSKLDPKVHNGAFFIGLNGVVVKSHGNADKHAFFHAIKRSVNLVRGDINSKIKSYLKNYYNA